MSIVIDRFLVTRLGSCRTAFSAAALLALIALPCRLDAQDKASPQTILVDMGDRAGMVSADLVTLSIPPEPGTAFEISIPIDGASRVIAFRPHSVIASSYQLLVQGADGELRPTDPSPLRTVRGEMAEQPDALIAGSVFDTGFEALIILPDSRRFVIRPLSLSDPQAAGDQYLVIDAAQFPPSQGVCGTPEFDVPDEGVTPRGAGPCGGSLCFAELACDADVEYYQHYGSSVSAVAARIQSVINQVNVQYENQVQISHVITAIIVRTAEPDPYSSTDPSGLLDQFRNEWLANQGAIVRDVAHLFTGKNINGSVIGIAYNIGAICTNQAYCLAQSDCCSPNFPCATDLTAHEMGHLWGAFHCTAQSNSTMNSGLQCVNNFNNCSPNSISAITAHRDSRNCLSSSGVIALPFLDPFPATTVDSAKWSVVSGATINVVGINEPSPPNSLDINGVADSITSGYMNLAGAGSQTTLSYWWERTGGGDQPEAGDDLVVEYFSNTSTWVEINRHLGAGPAMTSYQFVSLPLPAAAKHGAFRLRFRSLSTQNNQDDFFVDDVKVDLGDITPPTPNPSISSIVPLNESTLRMTSTLSTDAGSPPVWYFFTTLGPPIGADSSGWQTSNVYDDTGLQANTTYGYNVKAGDNTGPPANPPANQTPVSATATAATSIETPTGVSFSNITSSTIDLSATGAFTFLFAGQSGLFFDSTTAGGNGGLNTWVQITDTTATGLSPNTLYTFRVKARNRAAAETAYGPSAAMSTAALVPGAPVLSGPTPSTLQLDVASGGNPAITEFAVQCASSTPNDPNWTGKYANASGSPAAAETWRTDATWGILTVQGLQPNTQYTFRVKARNQGDQSGQNKIETAFGSSASATTTGAVATGACCTSGSCSVLTAANCATASGQYQGDGSTCTPSPCAPACSLLGDVNQDGVVTGPDIAGYARAKLGQPAGPGENQACANFGTNDLAQDTALFVAVLLN